MKNGKKSSKKKASKQRGRIISNPHKKKLVKKTRAHTRKEHEKAIQEVFEDNPEVTSVTVMHKPDFTSFDLATMLKEHAENKQQLSRVKMKLHNKRGAFAAYKRNTNALIMAMQKRYENDVKSDDQYISNLEGQLDFAVMLINRARNKTGQEPVDRHYLLKHFTSHA